MGFCAAYAQNHQQDIEQISQMEMKSAQGIMDFPISPNTANYDITYQRLDLQVDPAVHFITGSITTQFTALEAMNSIVFDLNNQLTVSAVEQGETSLTFFQNDDHELVINLPETLNAGASDEVKVTYSGPPSMGEDAFVTSTHNGTPILWTLSEPFGARDWWPCKQDLNDKISSIDVYITAPQQYVSVANGVEQEQVTNNNGTKTTHFHHSYPIPAYLVAIAVTNYNIYTQQAGTAPNDFPIVNYIYPEHFATAQTQLEVTPVIMDLFESLFETYPFHEEKYGHAQCGFGGGMEHTTVSFMGNFGRNLIAHELGHQWFGDKITCGTWKDIWLNEGFATYLTGLVVQELDGEQSFRVWKTQNIASITSQPGGNLYLTDEQAEDVGRIFSSRLSYNKGAMVLNMLRLKLGDEDFFQGIRNYLADDNLAYGYAVTAQLQEHLEVASGEDLDEFFNDWVYMEGYPTYVLTTENIAEGQVQLTINQTQSHESVDFFEMPVPVRLKGAEGEVLDVLLENTASGQQFTIDVPFTVTEAVFDPDNDIISQNSATLDKKSFSASTFAKLYPNPASGILTLYMQQGVMLEEAAIYNTLGQKVMGTNRQTSWNVSGLSVGVYSVVLKTSKGPVELKFVKE